MPEEKFHLDILGVFTESEAEYLLIHHAKLACRFFELIPEDMTRIKAKLAELPDIESRAISAFLDVLDFLYKEIGEGEEDENEDEESLKITFVERNL